MNLFYKALGEAIDARTAHGITRTGPAKVGGKHLSEAPNAPTFAQIHEEAQAAARDIVRAAHVMKRESTGRGLSDSTTPTCSCGWRGRAVPEYSNIMFSDLLAQERAHMSGLR